MTTAEEILNEKGAYMHSVSPDTSIFDALQLMISKRIGAILVKEGHEIVGIWTERDLMHNTVKDGFTCQNARIGDYMTTKLVSVPHTASIWELKDMFLGRRLRHLLIERDEKYIGLLSVGDVTRASLQEQADQLKELNDMVHLDYYDEWRWKKKLKRRVKLSETTAE
ncbi:MAG: CBS domain-containing protein [Calditrichia bacterium]|nr:CBS domain-containing protein [Calditrichota bacterium]MCB0267586.1 CBS domain-containing protein [Calditrichota bacterium]MCB0286511.1 CBS domain-containing protein [Calditrichota bacterium]MCB9067991.1 CBS domain-containing protein [Calditrichia bacterium]